MQLSTEVGQVEPFPATSGELAAMLLRAAKPLGWHEATTELGTNVLVLALVRDPFPPLAVR